MTLDRRSFLSGTAALAVATSSPLPAGTVTIYSPENGLAQVVGQDRIPLTPQGAAFTVTQGRSNTLQGTRRIVERVQTSDGKLVTRVEVVIENRGPEPTNAYVREGVENFNRGNWTVTQSSHKETRLGELSMEFKLDVPAGEKAQVTYSLKVAS